MILLFVTLGVIAWASSVGLAYGRGRGSVPDTSSSYWQGFAEGELHGRLAERHPSTN